MFDATSRYALTETLTMTLRDGREVKYIKRRILPRGKSLPVMVEVTVAEGERLDLIAGRTLGAPDQYWRICDANDGMNPGDLERVGTRVHVPAPTVGA